MHGIHERNDAPRRAAWPALRAASGAEGGRRTPSGGSCRSVPTLDRRGDLAVRISHPAGSGRTRHGRTHRGHVTVLRSSGVDATSRPAEAAGPAARPAASSAQLAGAGRRGPGRRRRRARHDPDDRPARPAIVDRAAAPRGPRRRSPRCRRAVAPGGHRLGPRRTPAARRCDHRARRALEGQADDRCDASNADPRGTPSARCASARGGQASAHRETVAVAAAVIGGSAGSQQLIDALVDCVRREVEAHEVEA